MIQTATNNTEDNENLEVIKKHIHGIRFAMLTNVQPDGSLTSKPMTTQEVDFDGNVWFFANRDSLEQLERQNANVNVAYSDPGRSVYVSMSGVAEVINDRNKIQELWNPVVEAYFPGGPEDPQVGLLCVQVTQAEYWDAPSSRIVRLFNLVKSVITGKAEDAGHHEKIVL